MNARIPAYRLAVFRTVIALTTLCFHLPQTDAMLQRYAMVSFHLPLADIVPALPAALVSPLVATRHVAAWALLIGIVPRAAAAMLAVTGAYIVAIDVLHYRHHVEFHLLMLALLAVSADRVRLPELIAAERGPSVQIPAWPEVVLRLQVSIVFFFAALDKLASPFWVQSGMMLSELYRGGEGAGMHLRAHAIPFDQLQALNQLLVTSWPQAFSWLTVAVELVIAAGFLLPQLRHVGAISAVLFAIYLEFSITQGYYAWTVLAAVILLVPVGDRSYVVRYNTRCSRLALLRRVISCGDWLRRIRWMPFDASEPESLTVITPRGRRVVGVDAVRRLVALLIGPLFVAVTLLKLEVQPADPPPGTIPPADLFLWGGLVLLVVALSPFPSDRLWRALHPGATLTDARTVPPSQSQPFGNTREPDRTPF